MRKNKRDGFTLIEIIVFTGIMGVMMVGLVGVLLNSLRARNRSRLEDIVDFNGNWVAEQLKWNLFNATYGMVRCVTDFGFSTPNKVEIENKRDNQVTTLGCDGQRIASSSAAQIVYLSGEEVEDSCKTDNQMKITCQNDGLGNVNEVEIDYDIGNKSQGTGWENKVTKSFKTKVIIRR